MMIKYEFNSKSDFTLKAKSLLHDIFSDGSRTLTGIGCTIAFPIVWDKRPIFGLVNGKPSIIQDGIKSNKFHVDILYDKHPLASISEYEVMPYPNGAHCFAGWEKWYEEQYNKRLGK
jgi:hypothetical protein